MLCRVYIAFFGTVVLSTTPLDYCEGLCEFDGPDMCSHGSEVDIEGSCTHYYIDRSVSVGRCYSHSDTGDCASGDRLPLARAQDILRDSGRIRRVGSVFYPHFSAGSLPSGNDDTPRNPGTPIVGGGGTPAHDAAAPLLPARPRARSTVVPVEEDDSASEDNEEEEEPIPSGNCLVRGFRRVSCAGSRVARATWSFVGPAGYKWFCERRPAPTIKMGALVDLVVRTPDSLGDGQLLRLAVSNIMPLSGHTSDTSPEAYWETWKGDALVDLALSPEFARHPHRIDVLKVLLVVLSALAGVTPTGPALIAASRMEYVCDRFPADLTRIIMADFRSAWPYVGSSARSLVRSKLTRTPFAYANRVCEGLFAADLQLRQVALSHRIQRLVWDTNPSAERLALSIDRTAILSTSIDAINDGAVEDMRAGLSVSFFDEIGVDAGGLSREWLTEVGREMVNGDYGFFQIVEGFHNLYVISNTAVITVDNPASTFKALGRIIALAITHRHPLGIRLARGLWSNLLHNHASLRDLHHDDPAMHAGLSAIIEANLSVPESAALVDGMTTSATVLEFGELVETPLLAESGPVMEGNKFDFVEALIKHRYSESVRDPLQSFISGFNDVLPINLIRGLLSPEDLNSLLEGVPLVDVEDMRAHAKLTVGEFTAESPQVLWLWEILRDETVFTQERLRLFLQFVTGDSAVPVGGFEQLTPKLMIRKGTGPGGDMRLPTASTCFHMLTLPEYSSKEVMEAKLIRAVETPFNFALC